MDSSRLGVVAEGERRSRAVPCGAPIAIGAALLCTPPSFPQPCLDLLLPPCHPLVPPLLTCCRHMVFAALYLSIFACLAFLSSSLMGAAPSSSRLRPCIAMVGGLCWRVGDGTMGKKKKEETNEVSCEQAG